LLAALSDSGAAYAYPVIQEFGGCSGLMGTAPYHPSRFAGGNYIDAMALIAKSAWSAVGGYAEMRSGWEDYAGLTLLCCGRTHKRRHAKIRAENIRRLRNSKKPAMHKHAWRAFQAKMRPISLQP
jgi:hypothetical protein